MRRLLSSAVLLAAGLLVAGCLHEPEEPDAQAVVQETADNLGGIESGRFELRLAVEPTDAVGRGFNLTGPVAFAEEPGALPLLRVQYMETGEDAGFPITVVSTGEDVWAEVGAQRLELRGSERERLRESVAAIAEDGALRRYALGDWVVEPRLAIDEEAPAGTDRIEGAVDVPATLNELADLARAAGFELEPVEGEAAEQLRAATRSSLLELVTGSDDRLLRRLLVEVEIDETAPEQVRQAFDAPDGLRLTFVLGVSDHNAPVTPEQG